jgi:hypothetical protein
MDFPETLATLYTQDTGRKQTKYKSTTHKSKNRAIVCYYNDLFIIVNFIHIVMSN